MLLARCDNCGTIMYDLAMQPEYLLKLPDGRLLVISAVLLAPSDSNTHLCKPCVTQAVKESDHAATVPQKNTNR